MEGWNFSNTCQSKKNVGRHHKTRKCKNWYLVKLNRYIMTGRGICENSQSWESNCPRFSAREIFLTATGIFRKYPFVSWYICLLFYLTDNLSTRQFMYFLHYLLVFDNTAHLQASVLVHLEYDIENVALLASDNLTFTIEIVKLNFEHWWACF